MIYNDDLYDFFKLVEDDKRLKLAGLVTYKQKTSLMSNIYGISHFNIIDELGTYMFYLKDKSYKIDLDQFVLFYAADNFFYIFVPDRITIEQYDNIIEIVDEVRKYEEEYNKRLFDEDYEEFIIKTRNKITKIKEDDRYYVEDIIGESIISDYYNSR